MNCDQCKQPIATPLQSSCGTGYATDGKGRRVCYPCCADVDRQYMRDNGKITLYLTCDSAHSATNNGKPFTVQTLRQGHGRRTLGKVTNWAGSLEFKAHTTYGRHNMAGVRYDAWFKFEGYEWHGVTYGDNTQLCHCKRTKVVD